MTTLYNRRDIWKLEATQPWHPITLAYAYAVREMVNRSVLRRSDPTGWTYQAAIHGTGTSDQPVDRWRNQCQHSTWFFLPWHRMYLLYLEQIMRSIIQKLDYVDDVTKAQWALPYWDYDRGGLTNTLPIPFRKTRLPTGEPNPLYRAQRNKAQGMNVNAGDGLADGRYGGPSVTTARWAFAETVFSYPPSPGAAGGFGGPEVGAHHSLAGTPGLLEQTPHNDIHDIIGGPTGYMSDVSKAALDPIFWLHHANIDRLWVAWMRHFDAAHDPTPTDPAWLDGQLFHFHDQAGVDVVNRSRDVLSTRTLGYRYESEQYPRVPTAPAPSGLTSASSDTPPVGKLGPDIPAEMVGATRRPTILTGRAVTVQFGVSRPVGPLRKVTGGVPRRVLLNLEGVRAVANPGLSYGVYLNIGDTNYPVPQDHYVGNLSFFGVDRHTDDRDGTGGGRGGRRLVFNVTGLYQRLRSERRWDDRQVTVMFVPMGTLPDGGQPGAGAVHHADNPVSVGRISLYVQ